MRRFLLAVAMLFCLPTLSAAQGGVPAEPIKVVDSQGRPRAGATVTFCTSAGAGIPCVPLASLFVDAGLTTPASNPLTTDGLGNLPVVFAAAGVYKYTVTGTGITPSGPFTATVAGTGGGNVTLNAANVFTAFNDFSAATMKIPQAPGFISNANSTIGIDTTPSPEVMHVWLGVDHIVAFLGTANNFTGTNTFKYLENTCYPEQYSGSDNGAKVQAAINDVNCQSVNGTAMSGTNTAAATINVNRTISVLLNGTWQLSGSPGITLSAVGAALICLSPFPGGSAQGVLQTTSATADVIRSTANSNIVLGCQIQSTVVRTAGAGLNVQAGNFYATNLEINKTWNGIQMNTGGAGGAFTNIVIRCPLVFTNGANNAGLFLGGQTGGLTISDTKFINMEMSGCDGYAFGDAMIHLAGGLDSLDFLNVNAVSSQGSHDAIVMFLDNETSSPLIDPARWVKCTHCVFEAGTSKIAIQANAYKDVHFENSYIATSQIGINLSAAGSSGNGFYFQNGVIVNNQQNAILLQGGQYTYILDNRIGDSGIQTNNTYNAVAVSGGITDFSISGNDFHDLFTESNHPFNDILVGAGASDRYTIQRNNWGTTGAVALAENGTGVNKTIGPNYNLLPATDYLPVGKIIFPEIAQPANIQGASQTGCYADSTSHAFTCTYNNGSFRAVPQMIASGTSTLNSGALATNTCQATVTTAAAGAATIDSIIWDYATAPGTVDSLPHISAYATSGNVNFIRCNATSASQTTTAIVLNWRVVR
jgi:hypothetical protein